MVTLIVATRHTNLKDLSSISNKFLQPECVGEFQEITSVLHPFDKVAFVELNYELASNCLIVSHDFLTDLATKAIPFNCSISTDIALTGNIFHLKNHKTVNWNRATDTWASFRYLRCAPSFHYR